MLPHVSVGGRETQEKGKGLGQNLQDSQSVVKDGEDGSGGVCLAPRNRGGVVHLPVADIQTAECGVRGSTEGEQTCRTVEASRT